MNVKQQINWKHMYLILEIHRIIDIYPYKMHVNSEMSLTLSKHNTHNI